MRRHVHHYADALALAGRAAQAERDVGDWQVGREPVRRDDRMMPAVVEVGGDRGLALGAGAADRRWRDLAALLVAGSAWVAAAPHASSPPFIAIYARGRS